MNSATRLPVLFLGMLALVVGDLEDMATVRQGAAIVNSIALLIFIATLLVSAVRDSGECTIIGAGKTIRGLPRNP
ncbi:MAG: hypothetical protein PHQ05_11065 [Sterolibacterium sp.]|nr:hypothetical protein [Sterolibacterium sp.]